MIVCTSRHLRLLLVAVFTTLILGVPAFAQYQALRANLHIHTNISRTWNDHITAPDPITQSGEAILAGLDVIGFSDHDSAIGQAGWDQLAQTADGHQTPIMLRGFEWTLNGASSSDHVNVFGSNHWKNVDSSYPVLALRLLYDWLQTGAVPDSGNDYPYIIAQFNHAWTGTHFMDFSVWDDQPVRNIIRLMEIGTGPVYYYKGPLDIEPQFNKALEAGWRVAPTIGLDNYGDIGTDYDGKHTGILATAANRISVMEALYNRRIYASEEINGGLQFVASVDGSSDWQYMGCELSVPSDKGITLWAQVWGTGALTAELLSPNSSGTTLLHRWDLSGSAWLPSYYYVTPQDIQSRHKTANGEVCLYMRVTCGDGKRVYSAPIWITSTAPSTVSTPAMNPQSGSYESGVNVSIACETPGATIHYTTNGNDPGEGDPVVSNGGSIYIDHTLTLKVRAFKNGWSASSVASASYTITLPTVAAPTFSPEDGQFFVEMYATIYCSTPGSTIHYTTNGQDPGVGDPVVASGGSVYIDRNTTLKARAFRPGFNASGVTSASYTFLASVPGFSSPYGAVFEADMNVTVTCGTPGATIHYTKDGRDPTESDPVVNGPVLVDRSMTLKARAYRTGWLASSICSAGFICSLSEPKFSPASGNYGFPLSVEISCPASGTTIHYTTDHCIPTESDPVVNGPVLVDGPMTLMAVAYKTGSNPSNLGYATYCDINDERYIMSPTTYNWIDPSGHTPLSFDDKGVSPGQVLPFRFYLFPTGSPGYTEIYVGSNGLATFTEGGLDNWDNSDIPDWNPPNAAIYPYWDTLNPAQGGSVRVGTAGSAPNRMFVISWIDVPMHNSSATVTFQAILCERNNEIVFQYKEVQPGNSLYGAGRSATIGIDDETGTKAVKYSYNGSSLLSNNQAISFVNRPIVDTPVISPGYGMYTDPQNVSITCSTPGSVIHYTTNGADPTESDPVVNGPILVDRTMEITARAWKAGYVYSNIESAWYWWQVSDPVFSVNSPTLSQPTYVSITSPTLGAVIHYTTNGLVPTESDPVVTGPILVDRTMEICAKAWKPGCQESGHRWALYTFQVSTPAFSLVGGTYSLPRNVNVTCSSSGAVIHYTTNGIDPTENDLVVTGPILVDRSMILKARAWNSSWEPSEIKSATYCDAEDANYFIRATTYNWIDPSGHMDLGLDPNGTRDSSAQTVPFPFKFYGMTYTHVYVGSNGLLAFISRDGYWLEEGGYADIPNTTAPNAALYPYWSFFDPSAAGASVRIGTVGSEPNRKLVVTWQNVPIYWYPQEPLAFQAVLCEGSNDIIFQYKEVQAGNSYYGAGRHATVGIEGPSGDIAAKYSYNGNTLVSNNQAILLTTNIVADPVMTPVGGVYYSPQSVSVSCAPTVGAIIHYTTNGVDPTESDPVVTGPIMVDRSMTLKARAWKTGKAASNTVSASYAITVSTPSFSPAGGDYSLPQMVSITCPTTGAIIHYTTNGIDPTESDPVATGPITVDTSMNLKARAWKTGWTPSSVASATYCDPNEANYVLRPCTYDWIDPSGHSNLNIVNDDSVSSVQTIPFTFKFYGVNYTQLYVGDNGLMGFANSGLTAFSNTYIPNSSIPNAALYPYWDDLWPQSGGSVRIGTIGSAPNRKLVVSWLNMPVNGYPSAAFAFQALLCEGSNDIVFQYKDVQPGNSSHGSGISATVGIEGPSGAKAAQYSCNSSKLSNSQAILFTTHAVADPVVTPGSGIFYAATNVSVSSTTVGSVIHYTTNGVDPTEADPVISGSVLVDRSLTLKARAWMSGKTTSNITSASYTLKVYTPTISPSGGTYTASQTVNISCSTPGADIHYTTNGADPTEADPVATGPIVVSGSMTIKAAAWKSGWVPSGICSATYTLPVPAPAFSPQPGTYNSTQSVVMTCSLEAAEIHYTTNGIDPTTSDPIVESGGTVTIDKTTTLKARAWKTGWSSSSVGSALFILQPAAPTFNVGTGIYSSTQSVAVTCSLEGVEIHYTTNGMDPTTSDPMVASGGTVTIDKTTTLKARAWKTGWSPSSVGGIVLTLQVPAPEFNPGTGTYNSAQSVEITSAIEGVEIHYTTNGVDPIISDPTVAHGDTVRVNRTTIVKAKAWRSGWLESTVGAATYAITNMWIPDVKALPDKIGVGCDAAMVSAVFPGFFYIESDDRACGIRVVRADHGLNLGMRADVAGFTGTNSDGERYIEAILAAQNGTGFLAPLFLANWAIGGSDWRYDNSTGIGQRGITAASGLNNIGLLVKVFGKYTFVNANTFSVDDGSGVNLKCVVPDSVSLSQNWTYVSVTGISSCEKVGDELHRLLRVRTQDDIASY